MPSRRCPVCGVGVKIENLDRHIASVHPRERASIVLSEEERRAVRGSARKAAGGFRARRSTVAIGLGLSLLVVGVVVALPYLSSPDHSGGSMVMHVHPHLLITINGQVMTVPANIGIDANLWNDHSLDAYGMQPMPSMGMQGMAPLHTHDTSGTIHVESSAVRDFAIGEFFQIWGQTFDAQQILGRPAQTGHRVWMVVDGAQLAPSSAQVLRDGMNVEIVCDVG